MTAPNSYGLEPLKATQLSARPSAMQAPFFSLNSASARPTGSLLVAPTPGGPSSLSSSPPPTPAFVSQQPLGAQQAYLGHPQASTLVDPSAASRAASYPSVRPQQPPSAGSSMFQPQGFGSVPSSSSLGETGAQSGVEQQGGHGPSGQQQPPQQLQQQDDTQVMTKLQQLMNQMGNFMKSVDARLTTLEKMTQQLISNQSDQAKTVDLRFQEIASLIQQKSSIITIPPPQQQQQQQQHHMQLHPASQQQAHLSQQQPSLPHSSYAPPSGPGGFSGQAPGGGATADRDYELARQLQEQFDRETSQVAQAQQPASQNPYAPAGAPTNLSALQLQHMQAMQPVAQQPPKSQVDPKQPSECPICGITMTLLEMEAHVNQHFDDNIVAEALDKKGAKKPSSFWDRLWGGDEPDSAPLPLSQQPPAAPLSQQPPRPAYAPAQPQMVMYPASMLNQQPSPGGAMYPSYAYPGQPQQPSYQNPGYLR